MPEKPSMVKVRFVGSDDTVRVPFGTADFVFNKKQAPQFDKDGKEIVVPYVIPEATLVPQLLADELLKQTANFVKED